MKLDIRTLSASLVAGFVSWYLCAGIYNKNADFMWTPLLVALFFLVLAAITCLVVRLTTGRRTRFMQFKGIGQIMTMLAVGLVALMVLAGLFELLFEIGSRGDSLQSTAAWDMLHYRPAMGSGWFLGVVRVLFLTLLGALVTALRAVAVGGEETVPMVILGLGQSLAGALVMEIGSRVLFVPAGRCWLILWVLLAATRPGSLHPAQATLRLCAGMSSRSRAQAPAADSRFIDHGAGIQRSDKRAAAVWPAESAQWHWNPTGIRRNLAAGCRLWIPGRLCTEKKTRSRSCLDCRAGPGAWPQW